MLGRLNFLFAVSILTLLVFYFAGRFVVLKVIVAFAPAAAPYFIAACALAALMLTVLVLAKTVIRLDALSAAARWQKASMRSVAAQMTLGLAHLCAFFALYTSFVTGSDGSVWWPWLVAPALYAAGIAANVTDLRMRALRASDQTS